MGVLYQFRCHSCGIGFEAFAPVGSASSACPGCDADARKSYSPPVTDCYSFGQNFHANRTPDHARKSYYDQDERRRHQERRELGITSKLVPKG